MVDLSIEIDGLPIQNGDFAIEIDGLPMKNGGSFHSYVSFVNVYQAG